MDTTTLTVCGFGNRRELNTTGFPAKLYRLTSNECYCSIWWAEDGTHIVIDVPKFESEILRNAAIPRCDRFKTMAFTSFIRQLNLYGFRKVVVDNGLRDDPVDWQRYAHAFFFRGRLDILHWVRRQPGPFHCRMSRASRQAVAAMRSYNEAVAQHLMFRGLRPSRKGPRPTTERRRSVPKLPNQIGKQNGYIHLCEQLPLVSGMQQSPTMPLNTEYPQTFTVDASSLWNPTLQFDLAGPAVLSPGAGGSHQCTKTPGFIEVEPNDINLTPEQWQALSTAFHQQQLPDLSNLFDVGELKDNLTDHGNHVLMPVTNDPTGEVDTFYVNPKVPTSNQASESQIASNTSNASDICATTAQDQNLQNIRIESLWTDTTAEKACM